ncbi:hypothetical protein ACWDTP_36155 [Mycobacterium sp. NPDC003449]
MHAFALAVGLVWLYAIGGSSIPVAWSDAFADACPDVAAQLDSWVQRADAHNNRAGSVNTYDHAAVDAYNAEKAQLEAERAVLNPRVDACRAAAKVLTPKDPSGRLPLAKPSDAQRFAIDNARKRIPTGYQPQPARNGNRETVPRNAPERALYDVLRDGNPGRIPKDVRLAGKAAPQPGRSDPVYPDRKIGETTRGDAQVSPDHIVPLAELLKLPGFLKLTSDQMFMLSRLPLNYQWLSWTANKGKNSGSAERLLPEADRNWVGKQLHLQNQTRDQLQDIINNLVTANGG